MYIVITSELFEVEYHTKMFPFAVQISL